MRTLPPKTKRFLAKLGANGAAGGGGGDEKVEDVATTNYSSNNNNSSSVSSSTWVSVAWTVFQVYGKIEGSCLVTCITPTQIHKLFRDALIVTAAANGAGASGSLTSARLDLLMSLLGAASSNGSGGGGGGGGGGGKQTIKAATTKTGGVAGGNGGGGVKLPGGAAADKLHALSFVDFYRLLEAVVQALQQQSDIKNVKQDVETRLRIVCSKRGGGVAGVVLDREKNVCISGMLLRTPYANTLMPFQEQARGLWDRNIGKSAYIPSLLFLSLHSPLV